MNVMSELRSGYDKARRASRVGMRLREEVMVVVDRYASTTGINSNAIWNAVTEAIESAAAPPQLRKQASSGLPTDPMMNTNLAVRLALMRGSKQLGSYKPDGATRFGGTPAPLP